MAPRQVHLARGWHTCDLDTSSGGHEDPWRSAGRRAFFWKKAGKRWGKPGENARKQLGHHFLAEIYWITGCFLQEPPQYFMVKTPWLPVFWFFPTKPIQWEMGEDPHFLFLGKCETSTVWIKDIWACQIFQRNMWRNSILLGRICEDTSYFFVKDGEICIVCLDLCLVKFLVVWLELRTFLWLVVTGTMDFYDFPFSWEFHHPNWWTLHHFSEG